MSSLDKFYGEVYKNSFYNFQYLQGIEAVEIPGMNWKGYILCKSLLFFIFYLVIPSLFGENISSDCKVVWEGSFFDLHSMSYVNRCLIKELKKTQVDFVCRDLTPYPSIDKEGLESSFVKELLFKPTVTVFQSWSNNWQAPITGKWVVIQPWDYGVIPKAWLEPLKRVDEIWVPSQFVKREYIDSGVSQDKVVVIPNGIDPLVFHPHVKPYPIDTNKSFKFLFVGEPAIRKGFDLLLKSFCTAFDKDDDVVLVVKILPHQLEKADFCIQKLVKEIKEKNGPTIIFIEEKLTIQEIARLYTACDCLIHPYRGEGFGLPMLEAMASGLAIIATKGGGADDFLKEEFTYFIEGENFDIPASVYGIDLVKKGSLIEPKFDLLVKTLKEVYQNPQEVHSKGRQASTCAHKEWTWEKAVEKVVERLSVIETKK